MSSRATAEWRLRGRFRQRSVADTEVDAHVAQMPGIPAPDDATRRFPDAFGALTRMVFLDTPHFLGNFSRLLTDRNFWRFQTFTGTRSPARRLFRHWVRDRAGELSARAERGWAAASPATAAEIAFEGNRFEGNR
jgi:hypothetical protein